MSSPFLIGQRVIVRDEIGIVWRWSSQGADGLPKAEPQPGFIWVHFPSYGAYAMEINLGDVKGLPNGQL